MEVTLTLSWDHLYWIAVVAGSIIYLMIGCAVAGLFMRIKEFNDFMRGGPVPLLPFFWPFLIGGLIVKYVVEYSAQPFIWIYNVFSGGK